ncbi:MAG: hypothetical protein WAN03_18585, partial [Candidatus Sulfotelmatobacter sp.]
GVQCEESRMTGGTIAERLRRLTEDLKATEQLLVTCDVSPRLFADFRNAVDNVRHTARVAQMWVGLKQQNRDPYAAISTLTEDRVRRATQMAKELSLDLQALEVDFGTAGLEELYKAIDELHERLLPLFRNTIARGNSLEATSEVTSSERHD